MRIEIPLKTHVIIGRQYQKIAYERFNMLCSQCGRLGHVQTNCPNPNLTNEKGKTDKHQKNEEVESLVEEIHHWTIVSHKKTKKRDEQIGRQKTPPQRQPKEDYRMQGKAPMHDSTQATKSGQNLQPRQEVRRKNTETINKVYTKIQPMDNSISTNKSNGN